MYLLDIRTGESARVLSVEGGHGLCRQLALRGIAAGRSVTLVSGGFGPVVVGIDGSLVVIGRGMARRIRVEKVQACGNTVQGPG